MKKKFVCPSPTENIFQKLVLSFTVKKVPDHAQIGKFYKFFKTLLLLLSFYVFFLQFKHFRNTIMF